MGIIEPTADLIDVVITLFTLACLVIGAAVLYGKLVFRAALLFSKVAVLCVVYAAVSTYDAAVALFSATRHRGETEASGPRK